MGIRKVGALTFGRRGAGAGLVAGVARDGGVGGVGWNLTEGGAHRQERIFGYLRNGRGRGLGWVSLIVRGGCEKIFFSLFFEDLKRSKRQKKRGEFPSRCSYGDTLTFA